MSDPSLDAVSLTNGVPKPPRNHRKRCQGRSLIRYKSDVYEKGERIHRKDDPILDADYARQYRPCEGWGAHGTDFCGVHGGSAPQTINAAKRTLALAADDFAETIKRLATDERVPVETQLRAAAQGLDRIGIRTGVDVGFEAPKWQGILGKMFGSPEDEPEPSPESEETKPKARKAAKPKAQPTAKPKFEGW